MLKDHHEWLIQAEYDMDTARYMAQGGRFAGKTSRRNGSVYRYIEFS